MMNEKNKLTSLKYWFPLVKDLGIPVPKTVLVECDRGNILNHMDGLEELNPNFRMELFREAAMLGYPVFMRTDLCAGKHDWKNSCFVQNDLSLINNLYSLISYNELCDIQGLPYSAIVLREFLDLETSFQAFPGDMPINKEPRRSSTVNLKIGKVVGFLTKENHWRGIYNVIIAWGISDFMAQTPRRQYAKSYIENNHLSIVLDPLKVPENIKQILEPLTIDTLSTSFSKEWKKEQKRKNGRPENIDS